MYRADMANRALTHQKRAAVRLNPRRSESTAERRTEAGPRLLIVKLRSRVCRPNPTISLRGLVSDVPKRKISGMKESISIEVSDGTQMGAYVSRPPGNDPRPAMMVFQEALGVNSQIRGVADRWAEKGFVAIGLIYLIE